MKVEAGDLGGYTLVWTYAEHVIVPQSCQDAVKVSP
jgi:hypothetical protein